MKNVYTVIGFVMDICLNIILMFGPVLWIANDVLTLNVTSFTMIRCWILVIKLGYTFARTGEFMNVSPIVTNWIIKDLEEQA